MDPQPNKILEDVVSAFYFSLFKKSALFNQDPERKGEFQLELMLTEGYFLAEIRQGGPCLALSTFYMKISMKNLLSFTSFPPLPPARGHYAPSVPLFNPSDLSPALSLDSLPSTG